MISPSGAAVRVRLDPEPGKRHIEASRSRTPQKDLHTRRPPRAAAWSKRT